MTQNEFIIYAVLAVLGIIGCCIACFILKQIILFAIIIIIFLAILFWYLYIYRNQPN